MKYLIIVVTFIVSCSPSYKLINDGVPQDKQSREELFDELLNMSHEEKVQVCYYGLDFCGAEFKESIEVYIDGTPTVGRLTYWKTGDDSITMEVPVPSSVELGSIGAGDQLYIWFSTEEGNFNLQIYYNEYWVGGLWAGSDYGGSASTYFMMPFASIDQ